MHFDTAAWQAVYEQLSPWVAQVFGETVRPHLQQPSFGLSCGSAFAQVHVFPWGGQRALDRVK